MDEAVGSFGGAVHQLVEQFTRAVLPAVRQPRKSLIIYDLYGPGQNGSVHIPKPLGNWDELDFVLDKLDNKTTKYLLDGIDHECDDELSPIEREIKRRKNPNLGPVLSGKTYDHRGRRRK